MGPLGLSNISLGMLALQAGGGSTIGGVAIGTDGSGIYSGFRLQYGDDFNSLPSRWGGNNLSGKYSSNSPIGGTRRINAASARQIYLDPNWRGWDSSSPATIPQAETLSVASSILTISTSPVPAEVLPYLPTDYVGLGDGSNKPQLMSGCLDTWPSFMFSAAGDFMLVARIRFPSGVARGWWPAFWSTTFSNWPDYGEVDVTELVKDASGNITTLGVLHISATDGGGDSSATVVNARAITSNAFRLFAVKKLGTTLTFYDDETTPGTLAQSGALTDARVGRLKGAHRVRLETAVSSAWDSSTVNIADWPKSMDIDWWQYWSASAAFSSYSPPLVLAPLDIAPGGSWGTTLPSVTTLYGATPTLEEASAAFDNHDSPGQETKSGILPGGMSINLGTRAVTGTAPATRGGVVGILLAGSFSAGGQAKQAIQLYRVAPAAQSALFVDFSAAYGASVSKSIAYTDFHSGSLGPHSYTVTNNSGGWLTASYGASSQSVTLTGTAPGADQTVTITIQCTNAAGQTTTVTRTLSVIASGLTFADNFNRANEALTASGNWTLVAGGTGQANIVSNQVQYNAADSVGVAYRSPDLASLRQYVQGKQLAGTSGFLAVQLTDHNNYIGIRRNPSTNVIEVFKRVTGTLTSQAAFAETVGDTDVIRLEFISGTLTVKKNGATLTPTTGSLTVTGGPASTTRHGLVLRINQNIPYFDDYEAGTIP
jgi:hypothetical protein